MNRKEIEEKFEDIDKEVDKINDRIFNKGLYEILGFFVILAIILFIHTEFSVEPESPFLVEGFVERIGTDSVIINSVRYDKICYRDLELLQVGNYVIIEEDPKSWFFECGKYRVTTQKITEKEVFAYNFTVGRLWETECGFYGYCWREEGQEFPKNCDGVPKEQAECLINTGDLWVRIQ